MRIQYVMRLVGQLVMLYGGILLTPFLYACLEGRPYWSFLGASALGFAIGGGLFYRGKETLQFSLRDSFLVVVLTWLITGFLGAMPFITSGIIGSAFDALFESASGITATGASILDNVDALPRAFILWRAMMHWLGGMGIIVLVLAVMRNFGADSAHFFNAEASVPRPGTVLPRIRTMAGELWGIYATFTLLCFALLWLVGGISPFQALTITFSLVSTGGFLPSSDGVFSYHTNYLVMVIMILFMILGGGNFALYASIKSQGLKEIGKDLEFNVYVGVLLLGGFLVGSSLWLSQGDHMLHSYMNGLFMYISMQTGTGFAIANYDVWPNAAQMLLFLATFIGGSSGSTTGGIKIFRFIVMFKSIGMYLRQSIHQKQVQVLRINGKVMQTVWIRRIWGFFFLYMASYAVSTIILALCGLSFTEAMQCTSATLSNVGLSFGSLGPTASFSGLSDLAKVVCVINMILGRLEIFTVLVVIHPTFWRGYFIKGKQKELYL